MADYPSHGSNNWDDDLQAYIEGLPVSDGPFKAALLTSIAEQIAGDAYVEGMTLQEAVDTRAGSGGGGTDPVNVPTLAASGPGWNIPAGSLDNYRTAKTAAKAGTGVLRIAAPGNSLTDGVTNNYAGGASGRYSYLTRVRELFASKGFPNGGMGHVNGPTATSNVTGEADGIGVVTTFTGNGNATYNLPGLSLVSNVTGQTADYTVRGTHLVIYSTRLSTMGRFRYTLDGGSPVTVECYVEGWSTGIVDLPGLADTIHTLHIENLGGRTWASPGAYQSVSAEGSTGPTAGTYYYVATGNTANGETTAGPVASINLNGSQGVRLTTTNTGYNPGSYKVYRSTSASGPFNYLDTAAPLGNGQLYYLDDGTKTPNASVHPPTGTNPIDPTPHDCNISVDSLNAAGAVFDNFGIPGMQGAEYTEQDMMTTLGLSFTPDNTPGVAATRSKDTRAGARHPSLQLIEFGANDLGLGGTIANQGEADTRAATLKAKVKNMCKAARAADCDSVVIIEPLEMWTANKTYASTFITALKDAATEETACWFHATDAALGPASGWPAAGYGASDDIHPSVAGAKKVATDLNTKILVK